jgi:2,3-bisphosphoglycerate-independent phosphoglycerate mutase
MGNSEVGHTTIGAGTILDTDLVRITNAARNNELQNIDAVKRAFAHVNTEGSVLHLMGLLGDGGVHAHSDHLFAFLRAAKEAGVARVAVHCFTDGRDTAPQSGTRYLADLMRVIDEVQNTLWAVLCYGSR